MVKIRVEVNYTMEREPSDFAAAAVKTRTVYLWSDKRALLEADTPLYVTKRLSYYEVEPTGGFIELWQPSLDMNPPNLLDDTWIETYKSVEHEHVVLEWHQEHNMLRMIWFQTAQTLQAGKILVSAERLINRQELPPPHLSLVSYIL